jgi:septum site-determining protein MinC
MVMASQAPGARGLAAFELKGASLDLVVMALKTSDLDSLDAELAGQTARSPQLFDRDLLALDLSAVRDLSRESLDIARLVDLLRVYKMQPVVVQGGSPSQMAQALMMGLMPADLSESPAARAPSARPSSQQSLHQSSQQPRPMAAAAAVAAETLALVIDKPLRAGQQVYARGRDLVVLGAVNPGAEVIADGNIHVYSTLRGRAIAGAKGNTNARIFSICMEPQLVSIAGTYRTSEHPLPDGVQGCAALVSLDGDKLLIEALKK